MKAGTERTYTSEFRDSAVKQVIDGGRGISAVARSLEISSKTLANWVYRARKGQALVKRQPTQPVSELEAELSRRAASWPPTDSASLIASTLNSSMYCRFGNLLSRILILHTAQVSNFLLYVKSR